MILVNNLRNLNLRDRKTLFDLIEEIDSELQFCPPNKREMIKEKYPNNYNEIAVVPLYPVRYENDLKKGNNCGGEATEVFSSRNKIVSALEKDGLFIKAINDKFYLDVGIDDNYWELQLNIPAFNKLKKIIYKKILTIHFELSLRDGNSIFINNKLHNYKPHPNSENDKVLAYLYTHPNRHINREEMKQDININGMKDLTKTVDNFKFTGNLRKAFFPNLTKDTIYFRNPVFKNDLP